VTRWDYKGQAYYVEATLDGTEGNATFGAGTVSTAEGVFNGNPTATLGNTYQPLTKATGRVRAGEIVIDVPAAAVGSPRPGAQVYSVGSYSLLGPKDSVGALQALPVTVDSTPTFDTALPAVAPKVSGSRGGSSAAAPVAKPGAAAAPAAPGNSKRGKAGNSAARSSTTSSSGFSKTAAVTTGGAAALLALLGGAALVRRRRSSGEPPAA
jgi:hypothetical protein